MQGCRLQASTTFHRLSFRKYSAAGTAAAVVRIKSVEIAFSDGSSPRLTRPKISIGRVVVAGLRVNHVTMSSSIESVKLIRAPEIIAGSKYGTITFKNAYSG